MPTETRSAKWLAGTARRGAAPIRVHEEFGSYKQSAVRLSLRTSLVRSQRHRRGDLLGLGRLHRGTLWKLVPLPKSSSRTAVPV